jgi:nucleotide-binding universal stress UspA family protein
MMAERTTVPFVESILHVSDFSEASTNAFAHALAIALQQTTTLTLLHVVQGSRATDVWVNFPRVRRTLEGWGLLEAGSPRSAVFERLGVAVKKVNLRDRNVLGAIVDYLEESPTDLLVLATEGRQGLPRWVQQSVAERLARRSRTMTLFVPAGCDGFVSMDDGSISLRQILVPVDLHPDPAAAIAYASRAAGLAAADVDIYVLHVGDPSTNLTIDVPESHACRWHQLIRQGNVVDEIIGAAEEHMVDLIVMATEGHTGVLDALRGSVTEQVLRQAGRPLLAVPDGAFVDD